MKIDGTENWCLACHALLPDAAIPFCDVNCFIAYGRENFPKLKIEDEETHLCHDCQFKEQDVNLHPCKKCGVLRGFPANHQIYWKKEIETT